ncbi:hypothetical protein LNV08_03670 [Paucibacter sp. TC2R-5]|uniref:hypothetical protein n=1 Tax=Paucibacter sp. TC2R-5 TaxID=2893555 RepID=UPI0021E37DAE|nr:hypothetical protein [Paucibacter sp. TC2R-5]MCV2358063.1 hypothetical protein [Paucibacter sp. TC2R-5]
MLLTSWFDGIEFEKSGMAASHGEPVFLDLWLALGLKGFERKKAPKIAESTTRFL